VLKGKYQRIPKTYSNDLGKIIDMCLQLKPSKRPQASLLVKNKVMMRHIENNEELKFNLEMPTQSIMDTIQPSSNMNLLQNRLPASKYMQQKLPFKRPMDLSGSNSKHIPSKSPSKKQKNNSKAYSPNPNKPSKKSKLTSPTPKAKPAVPRFFQKKEKSKWKYNDKKTKKDSAS
jgi:serine/threonine protein kinase